MPTDPTTAAQPRFGSLFTGIGGGDLGLERAGMVPLWQVEWDKQCNQVLVRNWPDVPRYSDIVELTDTAALPRADVIIGGDPCPSRSRARGTHGSKSPDLFPELLRIVQAQRPRWVLRENVVAGDVDACAESLTALGYAVVVAEVDSATVTGQSRPRQYLFGVLRTSGLCPVHALSLVQGMGGDSAQGGEAQATSPCLSTHPRRWDTRDGYVRETHVDKSGLGLRILSVIERLRLQGFPDDWLDGFAFTPACRMVGNAMTVPVVEHFGRAIAAEEAA